MALCANGVCRQTNKSSSLFRRLDFSTSAKHQNPNFVYKFQSIKRRAVVSPISASSATNIASDVVVKVPQNNTDSITHFDTNPAGCRDTPRCVRTHLEAKWTAFQSGKWSEFAGNVSGEWDGFGADFTKEGKPVELPENVVPDAFREWEVQVFDWQTQCPTLAEPSDRLLMYKLIKLLPTVGCEADAATQHSIDERNVGGVDNKASAFAYHSNGSYVVLWPVGGNGDFGLLEVEHCLVHPQDRESRVRIIQVIRVGNGLMSLESVKIFREQWYGPFRNGDQLGGCAIRETGFASTATLNGLDVVGVWHGSHVAANFQNQTGVFQELADGKPQKLVRDERGLVLLPKQLWCSLMETNGETCLEVGWLLEKGHAITSICSFSRDQKLKEIAMRQETANFDEMQP
ncbi:hypothetical protein Scep_019911 [Stephania cephalantha]|uniref:Uncharacterized protein n=1 Tax=Stephania cephalantha TaxID=152367 RepID=A0AAP0IBW7_9MAGN